MVSSRRLNLILFFTRNVTLGRWVKFGVFEREVALYRRLQENGVDVSFVTYGIGRDLKYAESLPGIKILCNRWRLPRRWYERLIPLLHARHLQTCDVIKTNQTNGADAAMRAARFWRKPAIARCGYMWSEHVARDHGEDSEAAKRALEIETKVFGEASRIVVTTQKMADAIVARIPDAARRISVIPNYVDASVFAPPETASPRDIDVIFVGRLATQKNISSLLKAVRPMDIRLGIIGSGSQSHESAFEREISAMQGKVEWLGKHVPNHELPVYLNRSKVFILPSHFEGHPKTLIEAMACGLPVIGANSPGIREMIRHGETGLLCGVDPESIRDTIQTLLSDPNLRDQLGDNARRFVVDNYSLESIVRREISVLREVALLR